MLIKKMYVLIIDFLRRYFIIIVENCISIRTRIMMLLNIIRVITITITWIIMGIITITIITIVIMKVI